MIDGAVDATLRRRRSRAEPVGGRRYTIDAGDRRSTATSPPWRPPATPCATVGSTKAVIAREIAVTARPADRRARRAAPAAGVVRVELPLRRRRPHRRVAGAARRGRRRRPCASIRWPARRRAPATPTTTPRSPPALIASTKNQVEHRVVIDVVHDTLLPWCSFLDWEPEPSIVTVANVQHLGTRIEGLLSSPPPNVLELVRALSPTPALGGHPRADGAGADRRRRGLRSRPLRRRGRLGRRRRQRHVGGHDPLRRAVRRRPHGPPARRRRHRRRQRPPGRAGRDPGQVPGHARRPHPPLTSLTRGFSPRGSASRGRDARPRGRERLGSAGVEGGDDGGVERGVDATFAARSVATRVTDGPRRRRAGRRARRRS